MANAMSETANTVIWSGEYGAYWRPKACGYTNDVDQAGIWPYAEAERMTRHCGPEKLIQLRLKHEIPEAIAGAKRRERAAVTLWHRFSPTHHMLWDDEPHKAEYLAAVDDVMGAINGR